MKTDFRIFVCLLPAVVLSGCKTPGEVETHYVKLDYAEYSFRAAGNQPLVVEVRTSPAEWSAESDASWCRYTEDEFGLTITVDDNVAEAERRDPEFVRAGVAAGRIAIPANVRHLEKGLVPREGSHPCALLAVPLPALTAFSWTPG